jgi:hypothetical protein
LLRGQFRFAPKENAVPFCPLASFTGARSHQLVLKFRKSA